MRSNSWLKTAGIAVLVFSLGFQCGSSTGKRMKAVQQQIDSLRAAGVMDSMLTEVEVLHFQAKSETQQGNRSGAKSALAQAEKRLVEIRKSFTQSADHARTNLDSLLSFLQKESDGFTGLRRKAFARAFADTDSLLKANQLLLAHKLVREFRSKVSDLKNDEEKAKATFPKVLGSWVRKTVEKDKDAGSNSTEIEEYRFRRNGSCTVLEKKKGMFNEKVHMDYKYFSTGEFEMNGDTAKIYVKHIKGYNRNKVLVDEEKKKWKQVEEPVFDSLVTNGSEDRFQTYSELRQHFKKK